MLIEYDLLSGMYIAFPAILVVKVHATVALKATYRTAEEADCCVQRDGLAPRTNHSLVLVEVEVIKDEWKSRQTIDERVLKHDTTVELGSCL